MNPAFPRITVADQFDTILDNVTLAISTSIFERHPLAESLQKIADAGFANIEIWGDTTHLDPRNSNEDVVQIAHLVRKLGLNVVSIHSPFNIPFDGNPEESFTLWEKLACGALVQAGLLGAELVVVHPMSFGQYYSVIEYRVQADLTRKALLRIADIADEIDLKVAVENMPTQDMLLFGRDPGRLHEFVSASGRDNLGLCLDTGHVIFNGGDPGEQFSRYADRIFSIHMHDNIRGSGKDLHLVPGFGSINWEGLTAALLDAGYSGNLVLELNGYENPQSIFNETIRFVESFFAPGELPESSALAVQV